MVDGKIRMCGFAGIVARTGNAPTIHENLLSHRGPDHTQENNFGWTSLRHWRLSIQDLSENSDQPINDDKVCLAYNGELYEYKELSKSLFSTDFSSDTLFLFNYLKKIASPDVHSLSGFFAFAFLNLDRREILLSRDSFGKKPLFYFFNEDFFMFASEETAIVKLCASIGIEIDIEHKSMLEFLEYKNLHFGKTFYSHIFAIPPGATWIFDFKNWRLDKDITWKKYYETVPFYKCDEHRTVTWQRENQTYDLQNEICSAISKRFVSDVDIQLALSGGIDSTLVAIVNNIESDTNRFKKAITVASEAKPSEKIKANHLCEFLGIDHTVLNFSKLNLLSELKSVIIAQDGPVSHPHSIAYNAICREVRKTGKVLITGEGADELFFGYEHYSKDIKIGTFAFKKHLNIDEFFVKTSPKTEKILQKIEAQFAGILDMPTNDGRDLDIKTHLLSLLNRNDRISMANSIELRSAFLDPKLFKSVFSSQINGSLEQGKEILSAMIRKNFPFFTKDKTKIGFYVPFDSWWEDNGNSNELKKYLGSAIKYFDDNFGLKIRKDAKIKDKAAWILVNIGIFLELRNK